MNDREIRDQIHHAMDTRLSGMTGNPYLAQRILAGAKGGKKVKKKLSVGLVVALVLMLASVTALAVGVLISDYYERVAQMHASGDMMRWELEDKINFVNVMRDFELTVDEEDYALMMDGTKTDEEREDAADRMIDARYGALIREEVATWYQQPEDISDVAPDETIIFKERYMAEHPEGITTREDYIRFTDALGYYLRDVYYPAYEAQVASLPQSTPVPEGTEAYAVQSLRSAMTELLSWDAEAAASLTPEVVWDEEYQLWTVSGEVSKASMEKAFEPVLDRPTIKETETGYRLTILVDTRGNASYFSLDKDAFRASHQGEVTPVSNMTDDEAAALARTAVMEKYGLTEEEIDLLFCEASYAGMGEDNALLTRCVFRVHYLYEREDMYGAVINRVTGAVTDVYSCQQKDLSPEENLPLPAAEDERHPSDGRASVRTEAALPAHPALAEEAINLSTEGYDDLKNDECVLPDGRIVMAGSAGVKGNYEDRRARLVCLNPDGTVAWDYRDPSEGACAFSGVQLLPEGVLGVLFSNSPDQKTTQVEIRRFTLEGQPVGEPIDIFSPDMLAGQTTDTCINFSVIPPTAQTFYRYYVDWNGGVLFRIHSDSSLSGGDNMLPAENGVLLYGTDNGYPSPARLMKLDLNGNLIWETIIPTTLPEADGQLDEGCQTSDGGYVFWLMESAGDPQSGMTRHTALVKYDANGRQVWANHNLPEDVMNLLGNRRCCDILEYGDQIVVAMGGASYDAGEPFHYLWFSGEGDYLGRTTIPLEKRCFGSTLIPLNGKLYDKIETRVEMDDVMDTQDTVDQILFVVPELDSHS